MKKIIGLILVLIATNPLMAQSIQDELPTTLKATMKEMGANLKLISKQVSDSSLNENSAVLTDRVVLLSENSKNFTPDTILNLPVGDRDAAKVEYLKALDQSLDLVRQLAAAFRLNDNELASRLLPQISAAKKDGHDRFKP